MIGLPVALLGHGENIKKYIKEHMDDEKK